MPSSSFHRRPTPRSSFCRRKWECGSPQELRTLLGHSAGIVGSALERGGAAPAGLPIADDGYGNHRLLDLTPSELDVAPVFFLSHDAPIVLYLRPGGLPWHRRAPGVAMTAILASERVRA